MSCFFIMTGYVFHVYNMLLVSYLSLWKNDVVVSRVSRTSCNVFLKSIVQFNCSKSLKFSRALFFNDWFYLFHV